VSSASSVGAVGDVVGRGSTRRSSGERTSRYALAAELDELSRRASRRCLALEGCARLPAYSPIQKPLRRCGAANASERSRNGQSITQSAESSRRCPDSVLSVSSRAEPDAGRTSTDAADGFGAWSTSSRWPVISSGSGSRRCSCLASAAHRRSLRDNRSLQRRHTPCAANRSGATRGASTHLGGVRRGDRAARDHSTTGLRLGEEQMPASMRT